MKGSQIIDSDRRCPYDGKLMLLEIGSDETTGWTRMVHMCLNCDYAEIDENWPRPKLVQRDGPTMAERLAAQRLGEVSVWDYVYPGDVPETWPEVSDANQAIPLIEGISYRQLDFWVRRGYLRPIHAGGSGTYRQWPDEEIRVAKEMARLVAVDIPPSLAARIARGQAPDVRVEVLV